MSESKEDREYWHNKGQEDAAKGQGNLNPPARDIFEPQAGELENRESYREGYSHGEKQR